MKTATKQRGLAKPAFHVLMLLDHPFPPDTRVENEIESLVGAGFEVTLLSIAPDTRLERDTHLGASIVRYRVPKKMRNTMRGLAGTVPLLSWFIAWRVGRLAKNISFSAVHAHDLYMCGGALRAARQLGLPVVGDLHESWVDALRQYAWSTRLPGRLFVSLRRWRKLERRWTRHCSRIIAITAEGKNRYVNGGCAPKKVAILPNTVNTRVFDQYAEDNSVMESIRSPFTVLYTGGIDLHRGLSFVMQALPAVLSHGPIRFVIVGEGSIRPDLEAEAKALGVAEYVQFTGWQKQSLIKSFVLGSDVCLVPHLKSGHTDTTLPHKLFHYMYLSRPVVVTNCVPVARIVQEAECGMVVDSGDSASMAEALMELRRDAQMRRRMGANGRRAVLAKYNWSYSAQALIELYAGLATK